MPFNSHLYISIYIILAFCFSLLFNHILIRFYVTFGIRIKSEHQERWNPNQKPSLGGISMYLTFLFSVIFLLVIPHTTHNMNIPLMGIIIAATLAFIMGFADDAYNTQPLIKFLSQVLCAIVLSVTGHVLQITSHPTINYLLTIFWVVFLMNALNLLDNMDGIVALVTCVIAFYCSIVAYYQMGAWSYLFLLSIGIIGAIAGFTVYNFYPSKIFMGDSGSQFLGLLVSCLSIDLFLFNAKALMRFEWLDFINCLVSTITLLIAPVADTLIVFTNRILKGTSPFIGGKDHTTHAFHFRGFRVSWISIIYMFISFMGGALAISIKYNWFSGALSLAILFDLVIVVGFFINTYPLKTGHHA